MTKRDRRVSRFLTSLDVRLISHAGCGTWRLIGPLAFRSRELGVTIVAPTDFVTDFASVPRVVIAYLFVGNTAHAAAVIHDYLYRTPEYQIDRKRADLVMLEAMRATRVPRLRREAIYLGVRMGGAAHFKPRRS